MAIHQKVREYIALRSGGRCEAKMGNKPRCSKRAVQVHHKLPRGRGGNGLDRVGETYHLVHLCLLCHVDVENNRADAYKDGLLISGYVTWDRLYDRPVYTGDDEYLTNKYGVPDGTE